MKNDLGSEAQSIGMDFCQELFCRVCWKQACEPQGVKPCLAASPQVQGDESSDMEASSAEAWRRSQKNAVLSPDECLAVRAHEELPQRMLEKMLLTCKKLKKNADGSS